MLCKFNNNNNSNNINSNIIIIIIVMPTTPTIIIIISPLHTSPSPVYPGGQRQKKLPTVLVHLPPTKHGDTGSSHSFKSKTTQINNEA